MGLVAFCLGSKSYTDAECDQERNPSECAAKKSSGVRTPQLKISNLGEFFGTILVSMAMNTSGYPEAAVQPELQSVGTK